MSATINQSTDARPFPYERYALGMDKITADEFRQWHAEQARLTLDEHRRYIHIEPCDCDGPDCLGWATIPASQWKREQREARRKELRG